MARLMPFHDATIEYFWRAVSGRRGSGADGAGGSLTALSTSFLLSPLLASLPSSHPIATSCVITRVLQWPLNSFTFAAGNVFVVRLLFLLFFMRCWSVIYDQLFRDDTHTFDLLNESEIFFFGFFSISELFSLLSRPPDCFLILSSCIFIFRHCKAKKKMNLCVASNLIFSISLVRYETPPFRRSKCVTFADPIYSRATCIFDNIKLTFYCPFSTNKNHSKKFVFSTTVPMTIPRLFLHLIKIYEKLFSLFTAARLMRRSFLHKSSENIPKPRRLNSQPQTVRLFYLSVGSYSEVIKIDRCRWRHLTFIAVFVEVIRATHTYTF